jgi:hypothetical protein
MTETTVSPREDYKQCAIACRQQTLSNHREDAVAAVKVSWRDYANVDWTGVLSLWTKAK